MSEKCHLWLWSCVVLLSGFQQRTKFTFLRVAVSLISIEGDEKFATKHKVFKFDKKMES